MPSSKELEETLPLSAPSSTGTRSLTSKYSVYTTAPLSNTQRQQLLEDLHSGEDSGHRCRLAPDNFQSASLRDVYDYHIRVRNEDDSVHPLYFIVADLADWNSLGVLMVDLDVFTERKDPKSVVGVTRGSVSGDLGAESIGMNLDIANMNWIEVKFTEHQDWSGKNPYTNKRYFPTDPRTAVVPVYKSTVYVWYSLVRRTLPIYSMLEPDWTYMNPGESRFAFWQSYARDASPWTQIRRNHPLACLKSDRIHRKLFLVAEKEDADSEGGLAIYRANWDADLSAFSYDAKKKSVIGDNEQLMAIQPEVEFVRHVRASGALQELDALA